MRKAQPLPAGARILCSASNLSSQKSKRKKQKGEHPQADIPPQLTQNA
jgi:hypothetical protein